MVDTVLDAANSISTAYRELQMTKAELRVIRVAIASEKEELSQAIMALPDKDKYTENK